jgi:hypothetical protein
MPPVVALLEWWLVTNFPMWRGLAMAFVIVFYFSVALWRQ